MLKAQFQAGVDSLHPFVVLMNTDSVYYQNQSYGWLKFNTGNVSNVSGNLKNLKVALIPTSSRVVSFYTVEVKVMNLYDSNFNLIASDTLNNGDSSIVFTQTLNLNSDYYLKIIANYPCNTCVYENDTIIYDLKLISEPPTILCEIPPLCYSIIDPSGVTTSSCCCKGELGCVDAPCSNLPFQFSVCPTQTVQVVTYCGGSPCSPFAIAYCTNTSSTIYTATTSGGYTFTFTPSTSPVVYQVWTCCSSPSAPCPFPTSCPMPISDIVYQFTVVPIPDPSFTVTGNCSNSMCTLLDPVTTGTVYNHDWTIIGTGGYFANYTTEMPCVSLPVGTYTVIHEITYSGLSCPARDTLVFNVYPAPDLSVSSSNSNVCAGSCSTLTATGADTYFWEPITQTGSVVVVCPTVPTIYTVTGTNTYSAGTNVYSCTSTATIAISATPCCISCTSTPVTLINATLVTPGTPAAIPWSSIMPGNNYSGLIALPGSGTISGNFNIIGNLSINAPVTFSNVEMAMATDGATIFQNASTTFMNSYLHACTQNWWGIKSIQPLALMHCFVEDAFNAIYASGPNHPGITCYDVIFNKNYTGIQLNNTFVYSPPTNKVDITGCLFTSRHLPNPCPYLNSSVLWNSIPAYNFVTIQTYPTALLLGSTVLGISNTIRGQNGTISSFAAYNASNKFITIGDNTPNTPYNYFDNLGNIGISGAASFLEVLKCSFTNMGFGPDPAGAFHTGIVAGFSSNCRIGTPLSSAVKTNTFVNCHRGVWAIVGSSVTVNNNTFQNNITAIEFNSLKNPNYLNSVAFNSFNNCNIDVYSINNTAIKLMVLANNSNFVLTFPTKTYGFYNVYVAEPSISSLVDYTVTANTFNGKYNAGVYAQNIDSMFTTGNTIILHPPTTAFFNAPVWLENTHNSFIQTNTLSCNPSATTNWNSFGIFNSLGTNNTFCGNTITKVGICMKIQGNCPSNIWANELHNDPFNPAIIGIWIAFNGFVGDIFYKQIGSMYVPGGNLFRTIPFLSNFWFADTYSSINSTGSKIYYNPAPPPVDMRYEPLVNSDDVIGLVSPFTPVTTFLPNQMANCQNFPFFRLSPGIPAFMTSAKNIIPDTISRSVANKVLYEFIRKNAINTSTITGASNFMSMESTTHHPAFVKIDSLVQKYILTHQNNLLTQAQNLNNGIAPVLPSDSALKSFNNVYMVFAQNDSLINNNHLSTLRNIAALCPYTHGTAVYQARALLAKYDTTYYYNGCEVALPPPGTGGNRQMNVSVSSPFDIHTYVYPIPAKDFIGVVSNKTGSELYLYDISGRLILKEILNASPQIISTENLEEGIYIYKIVYDNVLIKSDKLVIKR